MMRGALALAGGLALLCVATACGRTNPEINAASQHGAGGERVPVEEVSIAELEAAYLAGRATAHAVTQAHLDRINAYDKRGPIINSLITVNPHALEQADRLDAQLKATGKPVGPL